MRDPHDDCRYWGLTTRQCIQHHSRLAGFWARRSAVHAERTVRLAAISTRVVWVLVAALVVAVVIHVALSQPHL